MTLEVGVNDAFAVGAMSLGDRRALAIVETRRCFARVDESFRAVLTRAEFWRTFAVI